MNVKAKGNKFEREIAEKLSLWLTKGAEKKAVWRSDSSGGTATMLAKKNEEQRYAIANSGDLKSVCDRGLYPLVDTYFDNFVVETKHYKSIDFYPPFNKVLTSFFDACIREKEVTKKKSVLIIKANNRKVLYCQEPGALNLKNVQMSITYKDLKLDVFLLDDVISEEL